MAKDLNCTVADLIKDKELRSKIDLKKYVTDTVGLPTLTDILQELDKPEETLARKYRYLSLTRTYVL